LEEHRLQVFGNRVLKKAFWAKIEEVNEDGGNCIMRSSMICTP
jgi:hypothetical protein